MRCYRSNLLLAKAFLVLSSILAASAEAARPFPTPSNPIGGRRRHKASTAAASVALGVRGGWNPLEGVDAAKVLPKLGLGIGTATSLSTKTVLDKLLLFAKEEETTAAVDPMSLLVARRIGAFLLNYSVVAYFLQCRDASVPTAVGLGTLPIVVELAKGLFDGVHEELGYSAWPQALCLVVFFAFGYLFLHNDDSFVPVETETLLKIYSVFMILNGIFLGCFTKLACKMWANIDTTAAAGGSSFLPSFVSLFGFCFVSVGTLAGCFATDMSNTNALALGTVPFLGRLVVNKLMR